MSSVVANFSLINKVYIPKYIFPLSKCLFVGINFLLTLIPLFVVTLCTGTPITWYYLLLPIDFICLFLFTLGIGLILSTVAIFLRDMFYIYGVIIMLWSYLTPIMYDLNAVGTERIRSIMRLNPLYHYLNFARLCIQGPTQDLYDFNAAGNWVVTHVAGVSMCPPMQTFLICIGSSLFFFLLGIVVFRKNQDKFIYYV